MRNHYMKCSMFWVNNLPTVLCFQAGTLVTCFFTLTRTWCYILHLTHEQSKILFHPRNFVEYAKTKCKIPAHSFHFFKNFSLLYLPDSLSEREILNQSQGVSAFPLSVAPDVSCRRPTLFKTELICWSLDFFFSVNTLSIWQRQVRKMKMPSRESQSSGVSQAPAT